MAMFGLNGLRLHPHWGSIYIFSLVVLFAFFAIEAWSNPLPSRLRFELPNTAQSHFYQVQMQVYTNQGVLSYRALADTIEHEDGTDEVYLTKPRIDYLEGRANTHMRADNGILHKHQQKMVLTGRVTVYSQTLAQNTKGTEQTYAESEELTIHLADRLATSVSDVLIEERGQRVTGTGLRANLDDGRIQLLQNIRVLRTPN